MSINKALSIILLISGFSTSTMATSASGANEVPTIYPNLHIVDHPLIKAKLTQIRDKRTLPQEFRRLLSEIAILVSFEVTRNIPIKSTYTNTSSSKIKGYKVKNHIVLVPILRAGLGMVDGIHKLIPEADVAHIGMFKDQLTQKAVEYLSKLPEIKDQIFIVTDPMLASGNSAIGAIDRLIKSGVPPERIFFMSLIVKSEGFEKFHSKYPTIPVFAAALDIKVEGQTYSEGIGDAGDRLYGTNVDDRAPSNK